MEGGGHKVVEGQVKPGGRVCENGEHDPYPLNGNWDACYHCDMRWPAQMKKPEACRVCHGSRQMNVGDRKVELDDCDHCTDGYEP